MIRALVKRQSWQVLCVPAPAYRAIRTKETIVSGAGPIQTALLELAAAAARARGVPADARESLRDRTCIRRARPPFAQPRGSDAHRIRHRAWVKDHLNLGQREVSPASPSAVVTKRSFGHPPEHISRTSHGIRAFNNNTGGARDHDEAADLAWRLITTGAACRAGPGPTSHRHRLRVEGTRRAPWLARRRREHALSLTPDGDMSRVIL